MDYSQMCGRNIVQLWWELFLYVKIQKVVFKFKYTKLLTRIYI